MTTAAGHPPTPCRNVHAKRDEQPINAIPKKTIERKMPNHPSAGDLPCVLGKHQSLMGLSKRRSEHFVVPGPQV
jgi:hypothetical protein